VGTRDRSWSGGMRWFRWQVEARLEAAREAVVNAGELVALVPSSEWRIVRGERASLDVLEAFELAGSLGLLRALRRCGCDVTKIVTLTEGLKRAHAPPVLAARSCGASAVQLEVW